MVTTKVDLKRELPELYSAARRPGLVEVPELAFLMIDGHGDPNRAPEYAQAVEAIYAVAYTAKFIVKRAPDGIDFTVMPLEGLWWTPDYSTFTTDDKSAWDWTMMIAQPEQVTAEVVEQARAKAASIKPFQPARILSSRCGRGRSLRALKSASRARVSAAATSPGSRPRSVAMSAMPRAV